MKRFWMVTAGVPGPWDAVAAACRRAWPGILGRDWAFAVWDWTARAELLRWALVHRRVAVDPAAVDEAVGDWFWAACHRERPDVVWVLGGAQVPARVLAAIGELGVRRVAWALDDPGGLAARPEVWPLWDVIWSPEPAWYRASGVTAVEVPPAVDHEVYAPSPDVHGRRWDAAVVGGRVLPALAGVCWPSEPRWLPPATTWGVWGAPVEALPVSLRAAARPGSLPPVDAARVYTQSAVVVNLQQPLGDPPAGAWWWEGRRAVGWETLAVAACGGFQVVVAPPDWQPPWPELVTCTPETLADTLRAWLPERQAAERARRAGALQRAVAAEGYPMRLAKAWAA